VTKEREETRPTLSGMVMQLPSADGRDMFRAQILVGSCRVSQSIAVYLCLGRPLRRGVSEKGKWTVSESAGLPAIKCHSHRGEDVIE
jgi:hypothetical protein